MHKLITLFFRNPGKRLGNVSKLTTESGAKDVLAHPWFQGITLEDIKSRSLQPYTPYLIESEKKFTDEMSPKEKRLMDNFNLKLKTQLSVSRYFK